MHLLGAGAGSVASIEQRRQPESPATFENRARSDSGCERQGDLDKLARGSGMQMLRCAQIGCHAWSVGLVPNHASDRASMARKGSVASGTTYNYFLPIVYCARGRYSLFQLFPGRSLAAPGIQSRACDIEHGHDTPESGVSVSPRSLLLRETAWFALGASTQVIYEDQGRCSSNKGPHSRDPRDLHARSPAGTVSEYLSCPGGEFLLARSVGDAISRRM